MTAPFSWSQTPDGRLATFARNVSTRYVLIVTNVLIGLLVLPYNVQHLGSAAYGLWMLAASVTTYFAVLDLGYGGAVIRFVAEFRAKRDARSLNEVLSTMAYTFSAIGILAYAIAIVIAWLLPYIFNLEPDQVTTGRIVMLVIALQVALGFHFSIYGAVINGFERYYVNNIVGVTFNIAAAAVNVLVLWLGYGLVELVIATTILRVAPLWVYRRNAYNVFPELAIRRDYFRKDRLQELTGVSIYFAAVDWSSRLIYATDSFYLGIFMNTAAIGIYAIAQRLAEALLHLTNQLHTFLMPAVVHQSVAGELAGQRSLMIKATRFQLAISMCLCGSVAALASVLIRTWVGPGFEASIAVTQLLAFVVVLRAWIAMPIIVLQGTGHHKFVAAASSFSAVTNLVISIPLVTTWGLVGVALGTVIAVLIYAAVIFPRACRVVGVSLTTAYRTIVWPTLWPALITIGVLSALHRAIPLHLVAVLASLALGALFYVAIFVAFGLDRDERRWCVSAVERLARRRSQPLAVDGIAG